MASKNLSYLSDEELEKMVADDNPAAMTEKGHRLLVAGEVAKARKYLTFSSILGNKEAHVELARIYEEEDNFEEAYELYALAYAKGEDSILPNLARLLMISNKRLALEILRVNAAEGHRGCIEELIAYYEKEDNKKELRFLEAKKAELQEREAAAAEAEKAKKKH